MAQVTNLPEQNARRVVLRVPLVLTSNYVDYILNTADFTYLNLFFSYIRGDDGGAYDIRILYSPYIEDALAIGEGVETWYTDIAFAVGVVTAGAQTLSLIQQERLNYTAVGPDQENIMLQADIRRGMERIRIDVRETGNQDPDEGDLGLVAYLG